MQVHLIVRPPYTPLHEASSTAQPRQLFFFHATLESMGGTYVYRKHEIKGCILLRRSPRTTPSRLKSTQPSLAPRDPFSGFFSSI